MAASKLYLHRLLEIGNLFKDCRKYEAANVVFAIALELSKHCEDVEYLVETNCLNEINMEKNYFDLAVIKLQDQELNIPMPLLSRDAALAFMRIAKKIPRREHQREKVSRSATELAALWDEVLHIIAECEKLHPPVDDRHSFMWEASCVLEETMWPHQEAIWFSPGENELALRNKIDYISANIKKEV